MSETANLVTSYASWLRDRIKPSDLGDGVIRVQTPFLDISNDFIEIYVEKKGSSHFLMSDDGYVINDLESRGLEFNTDKRNKLLNIVLNRYGVKLEGKEVFVEANLSNFFEKKHNLIQAVLAIGDFFYMATPMVRSLFWEDVLSWFEEKQVRYTPQIQFRGKTGYSHSFDFVISKSNSYPERIIKIVNRPSKTEFQNLAFAWIDTKENREIETQAIALVNDSNEFNQDILGALTEYDVTPIMWTERNNNLELFTQ
jgi:hypothetical protein